MSERFDARAYWAALTPQEQQRLGEAAMLIGFFEAARRLPAKDFLAVGVLRRSVHAFHEGLIRLGAVIPDARAWPEGPDLAALGIRACRHCGCTDASACEGGCSWVEPDLCSRCEAEVS
jgi:hypothetical protein